MTDIIDVDAVETTPAEENAPGFVNITVTDSNVKYDSNLSLPEMVMWLDVVHQMIMDKVLRGDSQPAASED